jgi:hypothetical protein
MTVPLDRLYHFIEQTAEKIYGDRVIIYRFWPHGTKNIENLEYLYPPDTWVREVTSPAVYCHDQEPLMFDYYKRNLRPPELRPLGKLLNRVGLVGQITNLNYVENIFSKNILIHSEKRSTEVEKYLNDNQLLLVYYWNHAILARDWYRFAEHVNFEKKAQKLFLIYNRSWTGTREYRLKFADLLVDADLGQHCQTTFNPNDLDQHYLSHDYLKPQWRPTNKLEDFFPATTADSTSSADFDIDDYNHTEIEVVLETLFDDTRWHLTEKILRPIACGQPFILAATHGSLEYLKEYGFKTFDSIWNEQYDSIVDPMERMHAIVDLMKYLSSLDSETKQHILQQARKIANYNRNLFFSQEFFNQVLRELKTNLQSAFETLDQLPSNKELIDRYNKLSNLDPTNFKSIKTTEIKSVIDLALARDK